MDGKELSEAIVKLKMGVLAYKSGQGTQGDSANYYCQFYTPGWYISSNGWREHTIKCIPYVNTDKAVFMAQMLMSSGWSVQGPSVSGGRLLTYGQDIITWMQYGETASHLQNEAYAAGVAKGMVVFSNVDFYLETSYVDKTI